MPKAMIGLGANLGEAQKTLAGALRALASAPGVRAVTRISSLYRSAPVDAQGPDYLNAVAEVDFEGTPLMLLKILQALEHAYKRERPAGIRNAPRTLDLDILTFGDQTASQAPELIIPHPRMHERAFVLVPLLEIDPDFMISAQRADSFLNSVAHQKIALCQKAPEWLNP